MVKKRSQFDILYHQTNSEISFLNKALFSALKKGLEQGRKEISELVVKERALRSNVTSETKKIKKQKLKEKRLLLEKKLKDYKNDLRKSGKELEQKRNLLKSTTKAIEAIKKELHHSKKEDIKLGKILKILLQQKQKEVTYIQKEKTEINSRIKKIKEEKRKLSQKITNELIVLQKRLEKQKISKQDKGYKKLFAEKEKIKKYAKQKINNIDSIIKDLKLEYNSIDPLLQRVDRYISKKDVLIKDFVFSNLIKEVYKKLKNFNKNDEEVKNAAREVYKIKRTLARIEKQLALLNKRKGKHKKKRQELRDLDSLDQQKEKIQIMLNAQLQNLDSLKNIIAKGNERKIRFKQIIAKKKKAQQHQLREKQKVINLEKEEINDIIAIYGKKFKAFQQRKHSFEVSLQKIQDKRKSTLKLLKENNNALNKNEDEVYALETAFAQRQKKEHIKEKSLVADIQALNKELAAGKIKLKKIGALLENVKKIYIESPGSSPEMVQSFKKEKNKINADLNRIHEKIVRRKEQIPTLHSLFEAYKKHFLTKKNNIELLHEKIIADQNNYRELLRSSNQDLRAAKKEIEEIQRSTSSDDYDKQKEMVAIHAGLSKKISQINIFINKKQESLDKSVAVKQGIEKKIKGLRHSFNLILKNVGKNKTKLSKFEYTILTEKKKREAFAIEKRQEKKDEEEKQKIIASMHDYTILAEKKKREALAIEEESLKEILKNVEDKIEKKSQRIDKELQAEKNKLEAIKQNTSAYILGLRKKQYNFVKQHGMKQLNALSKKINAQERIKDLILAKLENKEQTISKHMEEKKKQIQKEKHKIKIILKTLRIDKKEHDRNIVAAKNRIGYLDEHLEHLADSLKNAELRIKDFGEKLSIRDQNVKKLDGLVKEKLKMLKEKRIFQRESHLLHTVINANGIKPKKDKVNHQVKILQKEIEQLHKDIDTKLMKQGNTKVKSDIRKHFKTIGAKDKKDMKEFLKNLDNLLGQLPTEEIEKFAKSKKFLFYKHMMEKYGVKG